MLSAWTAFLEDMTRRGLSAPGFVTACGAPGLEAALAALWPETPIQRCAAHEHRNLLAHAPKRLHDELSNDLPRHDLRRDRPPRGGPAAGRSCASGG